MAIGDTVQAGLMRIDTSAIERAGQAQAKANQAFGLALGEVAKGYFVGQEKKARANEIKEELMRQGVPEDAAGNISKNPFLQKEYARKKEAENRMDIAEMGQKNASDILAQKAAFEENRIKEKKEAKQITREANQLMRTRPQTETPEFSNLLEQFSPDQIPGTPEFEAKELSEPMGARPPLMASFATDKPNFEMFNVGKAPIEQQLPESFQGQAGRIIDMVDNNQISPEAADLALNRIQAQAMAEQKAALTPQEILNYKKTAGEMVRDETEFQQKQDAIGFKPERNYLDLGDPSGGGVRFGISGKYANETEVAKIKSDVLPDYSNMNAITDQLIKMGEDIEGDFFVSPSDKVLAESLKSSLQGLIREDILGPGTVNDSERAILEQVIENPVEYFNVKRNRRDKINSLKGLRKKAFNKLRTRFKGLGLDVSEFGQGGKASRSNKSPNMQNQTDSGLSFEEISLDDL